MELKISIAQLVVEIFILLAILHYVGFFTYIYDRTFGRKFIVDWNRNWKVKILQKVSQFVDWCKNAI